MPKLGRTGEHLLLENAIRRRTGALLAAAFRSFFSSLQPSFFFYSFLLYFFSFSIFFPLFSSSELITSSSLFFFFFNHNIYYRTQFYSFQRKILGHDSNSKLDPFSKLFQALPLITTMRRCILRFAFQAEFNDVERGGFQHADS